MEDTAEHYTSQLKLYLSKYAQANSNLQQSPEQWAERGATLFKRKLMGACGTKAQKSSLEVADILSSMKPRKYGEDDESQAANINYIAENLDVVKIKYSWGSIQFQKIDSDNHGAQICEHRYQIKRI